MTMLFDSGQTYNALRKRLDLLDRLGRRRMHCVPQRDIVLQSDPKVGRYVKRARKAHRCVGRNGAATVDDLVEAHVRDAGVFRKRGLRYAHRLEELFDEHLAGQRRPTIRGQRNLLGCHAISLRLRNARGW